MNPCTSQPVLSISLGFAAPSSCQPIPPTYLGSTSPHALNWRRHTRVWAWAHRSAACTSWLCEPEQWHLDDHHSFQSRWKLGNLKVPEQTQTNTRFLTILDLWGHTILPLYIQPIMIGNMQTYHDIMKIDLYTWLHCHCEQICMNIRSIMISLWS